MITTRTRRTAPVVPSADEAFWALVRMTAFATDDKQTSLARLAADWKRRHPNATAEEADAAVARIAATLGL